jgi:uncharacterized membrane protein (UPF0136 family)
MYVHSINCLYSGLFVWKSESVSVVIISMYWSENNLSRFLHIVLSIPHIHGIQSFLPPQEQWCPYPTNTLQSIQYTNPDYNYHPCYKYRTPHLLYLHLQEVEFAQRMLFSLLLGGIIGFERRASERPAGIRTMCMVCLGSCFFSMTSQLAFRSSTMGWDAARVVSLFHLSILLVFNCSAF